MVLILLIVVIGVFASFLGAALVDGYTIARDINDAEEQEREALDDIVDLHGEYQAPDIED